MTCGEGQPAQPAVLPPSRPGDSPDADAVAEALRRAAQSASLMIHVGPRLRLSQASSGDPREELCRLPDEDLVGCAGNPSAVIAAAAVSVGRMIETIGNLRSRKIVGSGMIRLVWVSSPSAFRSGKVSPVVGSVSGRALPALSCQVLEVHDLGAADAEQDPVAPRDGRPAGRAGRKGSYRLARSRRSGSRPC